MSIKKKYYRLRTRIIVLPLLSVFLAYLLFKFLLPASLIRENELDVETGIIQKVFENTYKYRSGYAKCIDIYVEGKPFFIRLSDDLIDKYWPAVNNQDNVSKPIEVKFQHRLFQDGIINNPEQVSIDNKVIIPYNAKQKFIRWFAVAVSAGIVICLVITWASIRTYRRALYQQDIEEAKIIDNSKLK